MPITVYAAKVNGSNYDTVPMNVKGSGAGGNGGAAARISQTSKLDPVGVSRYNADVFGSTVVQTGDVEPINAPGGLVTFPHNHVAPIAMRVTTEICGVSAPPELLKAANVPQLTRSIHSIFAWNYNAIPNPLGCEGVNTRRFTTAIRENHYNRFTGKWDAGYPVVETDCFFGSDGYSGDNAASPTRQVPGELTYKSSGLVPVNDVYKPKNG